MEKKIYKIFIASPSDTILERDVTERVFEEINNSIGDIYDFRIESLKWEKDVRPTLKNRNGQTEINEQIGDTYDIFIGIMSKKFGSPTLKADSGTEEEFNNAFERYLEKKDVEVIFYFNDAAPEKISDLNLSELTKIEAFKNKISDKGIYGTYLGISDFEDKLRKHLNKFFITEYKKKTSNYSQNIVDVVNKEALRKIFNQRWNDSLKGFDNQPLIWIEPIISRTNEISQNPDENYNQRVHIEEILNSPNSYVINAPYQFGLTTLGHYLVKEAWENDELWIFIDNNNTKKHTIFNSVKNEVQSLGQKSENVKCIVYDSWNSFEKDSFLKLRNLIESNKDIKLVILQSIDDSRFLDDNENIDIDREFETLHLLALPRNQIRQVVRKYNNERPIDEEGVYDKLQVMLH